MKLHLVILLLPTLLLPASTALALGGEGTGLTSTGVICRNSTTGQVVRSTEGLLEWDCGALGLAFSTGDRVLMSVRGFLATTATSQPGGMETADFLSHLDPNPELDGDSYIAVGDVDNDGDPDCVAASPFRWFENLGGHSPSFASHSVDPEPGSQREPHYVQLYDVDGDADLDIPTPLQLPPPEGAVWWENMGGSPPAFQARPIDFRDGWDIEGINPADVDNDGDTDYFELMRDLSPANTVELYWLEALVADQYVRHLILSRPNSSATFNWLPLDADLDGDVDLLFIDSRANSVSWLENEGSKGPGFTNQHLIDPHYTAIAGTPHAGDLDGDGDEDIVVFLDQLEEELRWYEQLGTGIYTVHSLGSISGERDHTIAVVDFSADGRLDIAFGGGVRWLENRGGTPLLFEEHPPTAAETATRFLFPGDIDRDGRIDLIGTAEEAILWQENVIGIRLSATGLTLQGYLCRNRSTGQTVQVTSAETTVDCEREGLVVNPGDEVEVAARGRAE